MRSEQKHKTLFSKLLIVTKYFLSITWVVVGKTKKAPVGILAWGETLTPGLRVSKIVLTVHN